MIVTNFDIVGVAIDKPKAYTLLVVYRNGVLPFAITHKGVQPIARWNSQIFQSCGEIYIFQLAGGSFGYIRRKCARSAVNIQFLCPLIGKRLYHRMDCILSRDACQFCVEPLTARGSETSSANFIIAESHAGITV